MYTSVAIYVVLQSVIFLKLCSPDETYKRELINLQTMISTGFNFFYLCYQFFNSNKCSLWSYRTTLVCFMQIYLNRKVLLIKHLFEWR